MIEMFISYCQKDNIYADDIDSHFKDKEVDDEITDDELEELKKHLKEMRSARK